MENERLISAPKLVIKLARRYNNSANDNGLICYDAVMASITDAPTVDAVEVVRCGECENAVSFSWTAAGEKVHGFRCMKDDGAIGYKCVVSGDDFCASGKRRTENAND